jgi:hypothetical protein
MDGQNLGPFLVINYIKNYQNMSVIKDLLLFLFSSMEIFFRKIPLIFDLEK